LQILYRSSESCLMNRAKWFWRQAVASSGTPCLWEGNRRIFIILCSIADCRPRDDERKKGEGRSPYPERNWSKLNLDLLCFLVNFFWHQSSPSYHTILETMKLHCNLQYSPKPQRHPREAHFYFLFLVFFSICYVIIKWP
jgi:hypothetical protein